ncbi:PREDICTED: olfactory receptor 14A16-like [Gekko japonicus]|uniref:Olfactory receptor 14A16-like n=1 Tax=Gekko japonicus TaxID=146911 RepID=A0ABM1KNR8_GEKJA|nr:PREDICTED: olfactory receptor 14A16-like [Gekko japonicus]
MEMHGAELSTSKHMVNRTAVTEFILQGFSDMRDLQILHFLVFLTLYLATLMGNFLIIITVALVHHLHTPMYFFLAILSSVDACFISSTVPKSMANSFMNDNQISFSGCVSQLFFVVACTTAEVSLLTVMAYDRYVAICHPLQYMLIMNWNACFQMAAMALVLSVINGMIQTANTFRLHFCWSNVVEQYFCDIPQLLRISCTDTRFNEIFTFACVLTCEDPLKVNNEAHGCIQEITECKMYNQTFVSEFLLLEFSDVRDLQILYFVVFLVLYFAIASGNLLVISAVAYDQHLHVPMYFFLMNLALQDFGQVSVIIPKSMINYFMNTRHISYSGCVAQVFFFLFFVASNFFLLVFMAYDRYVAICNPLHYKMVMNTQTCIQMIASSWAIGIVYAVLHTRGTFTVTFCSNIVNQFFCEIPRLLKLSCSDLYLIEIRAILLTIVIIGFACFVFIIVTYVYIFTAVLRIPSVQGRQKAFSTCLPHLIVFSTFLFTGTFAYLRPTSDTPSYLDLALTILYSMLPPVLNPVIYSMRNREIKNAMFKLLGLRHPSMNIFSNFLL